MTEFHRIKHSGYALPTREASTGDSHFMPPLELTSYRGHLPPPFHRQQYFFERRLSDRLREDIGNYGRGGYYGTTYQSSDTRGSEPDYNGQPDRYRRLGDRRWSNEPSQWENERFTRTGYRTLRERLKTADHRGKGPTSWRRSDQRLLEEINERLYDDPFLNATDIAVEVRDGEVFLIGTVDSRQSKRRAEDIAESVPGVRHMENRLRINERPVDHTTRSDR